MVNQLQTCSMITQFKYSFTTLTYTIIHINHSGSETRDQKPTLSFYNQAFFITTYIHSNAAHRELFISIKSEKRQQIYSSNIATAQT